MQPSHFAFLLAATAASTVVAQLTPDQIAESIPECARACIKEAAPVVGCVETNYRCQCEKSAEMNSKAYPCLQEACEAEDLQTTNVVTLSICEALRMQDIATRTAPVTPTTPPRPVDEDANSTATTTGSPAEKTDSAAVRAELLSWFGALMGLTGAVMLL